MQYLAVKSDSKIIFWGTVLFLIISFFTLFSDVCFPFVTGFFLAYFFAPLANQLSKYCNRSLISLFFTLLVVFIFAFTVTESLPKIKEYILRLNEKLPEYYTQFIDFLNGLNLNVDPSKPELINAKDEIQKYLNQKAHILASVIGKVASKGNVIASFFSFFLIMPISFYYFLKDWEKMSKCIYGMIPHKHKKIFIEAAAIAHNSLNCFFKGQFCVVGILYVYYSILLYSIGIKHFISLGFLSGLFSFIPCIGAFFSFLLVLFVSAPALTLTKLYILIVIYFVGQFIEGYILSPNLVGKKTGLHPLWILFSFFAGIQLKGIWGVLIAIPLATIIRNLLYFVISKVKAAQFFKQ